MSLCCADQYDLVIVGGGMVGASLGCILDQAGIDSPPRILLVESAPIDLTAPPAQPSFDARSTVLSHGTVGYFRDLGWWDDLSEHAEPISRIHVSDQGRFGTVKMNSAEQGVDALGHVIENRLLGTVFNKSLAAAENLEVLSGITVAGIRPVSGGMEITLGKNNSEVRIETALVVLSEGGRSGLCEKLGIHHHSHSYGQEAVITNVAFTQPHDKVAYERFTPNGPLALLPLPDHEGLHRAALVWTRNTREINTILELSETEFLGQLQEEFGERLGEFIRAGDRHSYPLKLSRAEEQVRPGLVLLGNVAHSLHPVAGQGFNLAFRDTMCLADLLIEGMKRGEAPGAISLLQRYQEATEKDQDRTAAMSHYMTRLFSTENSGAVLVRKFGLFSIDLILPFRRAFARRAMGLGGSRVKLDTRARIDQIAT